MKGRINERCQLPWFLSHTQKGRKHKQQELNNCNIRLWIPCCWESYSRVQISGFIFCSCILKYARQRATQLIRTWEVVRNCLMTSSQMMHKVKCKVTFEKLLTDLPSSPALGKSQGLLPRLKLWFILDTSKAPRVGRAIALHTKDQRQKIIFLWDC